LNLYNQIKILKSINGFQNYLFERPNFIESKNLKSDKTTSSSNSFEENSIERSNENFDESNIKEKNKKLNDSNIEDVEFSKFFKCTLNSKRKTKIKDMNSILYPGDKIIVFKGSSKRICKIYKCTQCNTLLAKKWHYLNHKRTHSDERPFQCKICSKRFIQQGNVVKHVKIVHFQLKPFECEYCNKNFSTKYNLNIHFKACKNHPKKVNNQ
jgi:hypothetical protein